MGVAPADAGLELLEVGAIEHQLIAALPSDARRARAPGRRADLAEDYSHLEALGAAVSASGIAKLSLAGCGLDAVGLAAFVGSVSWESAALTEIDVRYNWQLLDEASLDNRVLVVQFVRLSLSTLTYTL